MDGAKEEGGPESIAMESSLTVSETVVERMVCEGQIPMQEEGEEGPSNGDDIMVEVLGSHVYVDGICTTDGGDGGMNEAVHGESGEVDLEGNPRNLESEGDDAGDLGSRSEVPSGEAETRNEVSAAEVEGSGTDHNGGNGEGGGDGNQALEAQNVGNLVGDDLNHGEQESVVCSSAASEDSRAQTKVFEETMSDTMKEDVDAKFPDVKTQITAEDTPRSDSKDAAFSFQSTESAAESGLDEKVNTNMETAKQGTDSEQRHTEVDIPQHSSENHATRNDQSLKAETVINGGEDGDLSMGAAMDVEQQVSDAKNVGCDADKDVKVQENSVEIETMGVGTENHRNVSENLEPSCQQTYVFVSSDGGEATKVDDSVSNQMHSSHSMGNEDLLTENAASKDDSRVVQDMNGEEQVTSDEHDGLDQLQEMDVEEHDSESEQPTNLDEKTVKRMGLRRSASAIKVHRARYQLLPQEEGEFSVSDLVWGKVRSHPWWPGQIFDPSDASEKAVKHHKKDTYLVAYFGDRTFAWNEASVLKPFRSHFSQIEKQSNSESFQNAVDCALDEVSRRTELGLACSCIPQDVYDKIKCQEVENAGVRQESSIGDVVDLSLSASFFEPDKLLDYMKALAESPAGGGDRLDLAIAKAQLLAFYRLKGYHQLPEFRSCGDLCENETNTSHSEEKMQFGDVIEHGTPMDTDCEQISSGQETSKTKKLKRKHNLKDGLYPCKRKRSLTELMGGTFDSPDTENGSHGMAPNKLPSSSSGKKRKTVDSFEDPMMQEGRKTISLAKVSQTPPPKPSFKIGECIRRAASQMTASPSILKSTGDRPLKLDGGSENPAADAYDVPVDNFDDALQKMTNFMANNSSLEELLSQLHEAACDPMKSSFSLVVNFFSNFRDSVVVEQPPGDKTAGKRKKSPNSIIGSPETFEFEDMNDTYWTDRIVQNGSEEKPSLGNGMGHYQIVPVQLEEKPIQKGRKSRKRYSNVNHDLTAQKPLGYVDERAPAELVMNFTEINSVPSETKLNKMFKHFGPLKESETEVDRETSRARVVFRRTSDAEVAYNSAGKFNIFGPVAVNYQLNYTISESFKASLYAPTLAEENHHISSSLFEDHDMGDENSLMHPSLGEEASFMVSTLGEETLPIATTFHEELHSSFGEGTMDLPTTLGNQTLVIGTSMYEETMPIATGMYEHTMPIATSIYEHTIPIPASMYEETFPIATSAGEGPMDVDTTIGDQTFIAATTVGEQFSTIVTTISEQTSIVASTLAEEAYPFSTTLSNETSTITTTLGEENSGIATIGQDSSTIPTTLAEETPTYPVHLAEETPNIPRTLVKETPVIPTAEETPSIPSTLGEETPAIPLAEETPSLPSTLGEETPNIPLAEETPSIPRTLGEETPAIPLEEETPSIPRTLGEETPTVTLVEETASVPRTLGEETSAIPATSSEETPTILPTFSEENTTLPPTFNEETLTIPLTLGQETETIPTTIVEKTMTTPETLGKETTTVPATLHEGTPAILTTLAEESQTTEVLGEETPTNPTNLGDETPTSPTTLGEEYSIAPTTLAEETSTVHTTLGEEASTDPIANGEETSTVSTTMEMETSPPNVAESKEHAT